MIAVDAMGGDFAPHAIVEGSLLAAKKGIPITLFGDKTQLILLLAQHTDTWQNLPLTIIHCSDVIGMDEEPSKSVLRKKNSSLVCAINAVKEGFANAFVSAGNSGAVLVASTLLLGRVDGILRPALGGFLPGQEGTVFCIDLGANTDCKVEYLEQFAIMGHAYVRLVKQIARPRIALLSNGHEPYKGSSVVKEAYQRLMHAPLNFVGNVEARNIFNAQADVLVCDGFVGNIMLKTAQGTIHTIINWLKEESKKSWFSRLALLISSPMLKRLKEKTDYAKVGGAVLLGVTHPVIVAHGSSSGVAIMQAIIFAHTLVSEKRIETFNKVLNSLIKTEPCVLTLKPTGKIDSYEK